MGFFLFDSFAAVIQSFTITAFLNFGQFLFGFVIPILKIISNNANLTSLGYVGKSGNIIFN